jgi:hypothetical protein
MVGSFDWGAVVEVSPRSPSVVEATVVPSVVDVLLISLLPTVVFSFLPSTVDQRCVNTIAAPRLSSSSRRIVKRWRDLKGDRGSAGERGEESEEGGSMRTFPSPG